MKKSVSLLATAILSGCSYFPKYQTPFSVEDPSIKGDNLYAAGTMISSTKKRYWLSYKNALLKGGYTVEEASEFPNFRTTGLSSPTSDVDANYQFWKEGQAYAKSLCSDFFRRISLAQAHREHAKKQTNILGGLVTAGMGLAGSSAEAVGAAGLTFSGVGSSFDAYDSSYLVTPDLGLMEALVRAVQENKSLSVSGDDLTHVSDVIIHLNEYVYPCTFTGMKALLDNSLNKNISELQYAPFSPQR